MIKGVLEVERLVSIEKTNAPFGRDVLLTLLAECRTRLVVGVLIRGHTNGGERIHRVRGWADVRLVGVIKYWQLVDPIAGIASLQEIRAVRYGKCQLDQEQAQKESHVDSQRERGEHFDEE